MKIIADENLKDVEKYFAEYGRLELLPGREINRQSIADADVLLIRSVTNVDRELLTGSQVKFVGSATSGVEHVDQEFLQGQGIYFCHSKGSNAAAVAQYCLAALSFSQAASRFDGKKDSVGIVGCGFVGSSLALLLRGLDIPVKVYDPLLDENNMNRLRAEAIQFASLPEVFDCAAVSLHVPLTSKGSHATANLIERSLLARLTSTATFINACRGGVVNEPDLIECLNNNPGIFVALDVWNSEPLVNAELLSRANIATPHMAGYSKRAKAGATQMLLQQFRSNFLHLPVLESEPVNLSPDELEDLNASDGIAAMMKALPLDQLSERFKAQIESSSPNGVASVFDAFRKSMINRTEFADYSVNASGLTVLEVEKLSKLGFSISP